jgi:ribosomal protein L31
MLELQSIETSGNTHPFYIDIYMKVTDENRQKWSQFNSSAPCNERLRSS